MRIGTLTMHSQLNYGAVLQAFALRVVLERMGHDAVVIDRWLDAGNRKLLGPYANLSAMEMLKLLVRGLLGLGAFGVWRRHWRTQSFLRRRFRLTSYHFHTWNEAPKDLGLDLIVVGSDLVWADTKDGRVLVYLLEGAPPVAAISYASSFGCRKLRESRMPDYRRGFARFHAIGVRELEGVRLVEEMGFRAMHVVDPVLLAGPELWKPFARRRPERLLVCYLVAVKPTDALSALADYAKSTGNRVEVFFDKCRLHRPLNPFSSVKFSFAAGPEEFLSAVQAADAMITDSFHGFAFAAMFGKNVRVLRPDKAWRANIFARISELADAVASGPVFADTVASAVASLKSERPVNFDSGMLARLAERSRTWLESAVAEVEGRAR